MQFHWHESDYETLTPDEVRAYCQIAPDYIREQDDFGYTNLIAACLRGRTAVARVLLEAGADPNFGTEPGTGPPRHQGRDDRCCASPFSGRPEGAPAGAEADAPSGRPLNGWPSIWFRARPVIASAATNHYP
jgi:hypothetical protein